MNTLPRYIRIAIGLALLALAILLLLPQKAHAADQRQAQSAAQARHCDAGSDQIIVKP